MLKEGLIVCPKKTNEGKDLWRTSELLERKLLESFGGCTRSNATGSWIDPESGELYREPVWQFATAYEDTEENHATLITLGNMLTQLAEQVAVYVRLCNGEVIFCDGREQSPNVKAA